MQKRIWIISEFYYPIVTSTGFYVTEIAEFLAKNDFDVHVITTASRYNEIKTIKVTKEEIYNNVTIHRVLSADIDKNNFIKRAFRLLLTSISLFFYILRNVRRNEELLVLTNPAFLLAFMPIIAKLKRVHYKLLVHDIFPENLVAIKKVKESSLVFRILKFVFDKAYIKATTCISIGRDMREVIKNKGVKEANILMIPNWSDNKDVYPIDKHNTKMFVEMFSVPFIFQFAGNLGYAQGLDNILEAITLVKNENIGFFFIGGGAKADQINEFSKHRRNVKVIGFQDRANQCDFINACDIGIVTLSDGMFGLGVPSKSYNIMAAGKPILYIGEETSEIALCIKEYLLGWIVSPNNPQKLKDTIEEIYTKRSELSQIRKNARKVADDIFAKDIILNKYISVFK